MSDTQADSAGSIPVTRSQCEKRCHTYELGAILPSGSKPVGHQKSALVPSRVPLACWGCLSALVKVRTVGAHEDFVRGGMIGS